MDIRRGIIALLTIGLSISLGACASGPDEGPDDGREVETVEVQRDDRDNLQEAFETFLSTTEIATDIEQEGDEAYRAALQEKASAQLNLESRLRNFREGSAPGGEEYEWASVRLAQTYLNVGCELNQLEGRPGQEEEGSSLEALAHPVIMESVEFVLPILENEESPWFTEAREIASALNDYASEPAQICESTGRYWQADTAGDVAK